MEKIKQFIQVFFNEEAMAFHKRHFPDIEKFNRQLKQMNSYCVEEMHNTFGMVPLKVPKEQKFYEKWKNKPAPSTRHIFKISEYSNSKYGQVYVVYSSEQNADDDYFDYFDCFFVTKIDDELKIIKRFYFDDDSAMLDHKIWIESHGLKEITFETIGEFVKTERYFAPEDCEFSMEDYNEDK